MKVVRMPGTTTPKYKRNFNRETSRWDYLISPNRYSTEILNLPSDKRLYVCSDMERR